MASPTAVDFAAAATMAPSTLDLLVLTFNCAKNLINAAVFAGHLQAAFGSNAAALPDLVVLSLQEVAPMSYAFIGGYFLNPYLARFEDAVNLAALQFQDEHQSVSVTPTAPGPRKPYSLVRAHNVGYTAILLFARDPARLSNLQQAEVGFGAADMGNKGAVGLRALYEAPGGGGRSTELTFVATHLAAMEWNLPRRNANWAAIMRGLTFEDPEAVLKEFRSREASPTGEATYDADGAEGDEAGERVRLLHDEHDERHARLQQRLHDISVFKPSSHLFVAGDLNYRISAVSPPPGAAFPSLDPDSENYYPAFFPLDQLTRERTAGRTLHGLSEAEVRFPPTYKCVVRSGSSADPKAHKLEGDGVEGLSWSFASHRYPSWTDRVLYLDMPPWVAADKATTPEGGPPRINVLAYDALPLQATSDHRPVFFRAEVPLVAPADLSPPASLSEPLSGEPGAADPRARLPVEIDPEAWGRRAAVRRREVMAGWSMFLWSTKQGALVLATLLVVGAGAYWLHGAE